MSIYTKSPPTRAIGTSTTPASVIHSRLPLMQSLAPPPDFLARSRRNLIRGQYAVFGRMPFFGKRWIKFLKGFIKGNKPTSTIRASAAFCPVGNNRLPLMPLFASPPYTLVRMWPYIPGL